MAENLERDVAGEYNTFRVYVYLLRKKTAGKREVQRDLGFSSPQLAAHHLEKLVRVGLAKEEGFYFRVVPQSFGVLRFFFVVDRWIVPKTFFLAVVFLTITVGFLVILPRHPYLYLALFPSVLGLVASILLSLYFHRLLPKT